MTATRPDAPIPATKYRVAYAVLHDRTALTYHSNHDYGKSFRRCRVSPLSIFAGLLVYRLTTVGSDPLSLRWITLPKTGCIVYKMRSKPTVSQPGCYFHAKSSEAINQQWNIRCLTLGRKRDFIIVYHPFILRHLCLWLFW
jgi:hypothetical protein